MFQDKVEEGLEQVKRINDAFAALADIYDALSTEEQIEFEGYIFNKEYEKLGFRSPLDEVSLQANDWYLETQELVNCFE